MPHQQKKVPTAFSPAIDCRQMHGKCTSGSTQPPHTRQVLSNCTAGWRHRSKSGFALSHPMKAITVRSVRRGCHLGCFSSRSASENVSSVVSSSSRRYVRQASSEHKPRSSPWCLRISLFNLTSLGSLLSKRSTVSVGAPNRTRLASPFVVTMQISYITVFLRMQRALLALWKTTRKSSGTSVCG